MAIERPRRCSLIRRMRRKRLPAAAVVAILMAGSCGCHPTDRQVIREFERHRADYELLRVLAEQDRHLGRIASTWYETESGSQHDAPRAGLLSGERWSRYRRLFHRLELDAGVAT